MWLWDPAEYNLQVFYNQGDLLQIWLCLWKKTYYHNLLHYNQHGYKEIFNLTNQFLIRNVTPSLLPSSSNLQSAMDFNEFFCDKINWIMVGQNTSTVKVNTNYIEDAYETKHRFDTFQTVIDEEVLRIINKPATNLCELDALPMHLLKQHKDTVLPSITSIVNAPLQSSTMPANMKSALVCPLLKKLGLPLIKKNYRPVSNLFYISKVIEWAECNQLTRYVESTSKLEEC